MVGRIKDARLADIREKTAYSRFSDEDNYDLGFVRQDFDRCEWRNLRIKAAKFRELSLTHSRFVDCYMSHVEFDRVDLTGTHFLRCSLHRAKFSGVKLWYVEFEDCDLNYEALLTNLPREVNLRRRLLHNLRLNALQRREREWASRLLLLEMAAKREEDRSILLASDSYFRNSFSPRDRVLACGRLAVNLVEHFVWGYGIRLRTLFRTAVLMILAGATVAWLGEVRFGDALDGGTKNLAFFESLFMATVTFTTIGGFFPESTLGRFLTAALSLSGGLFLGLLAAAAYKRIER